MGIPSIVGYLILKCIAIRRPKKFNEVIKRILLNFAPKILKNKKLTVFSFSNFSFFVCQG